MKKIYLSLLGAMMALTVGAQPQRGAQQQISNSYTVYAVNPVTNEKTRQEDYTYENGKLTEIHYTYYYAEGNVESKYLRNYDDQGRLLSEGNYVMRDGEYVATYLEESEGQEWNEDGLPTIVVIYEENDSGQLVLRWKNFIYGYNGIYAVNRDEYVPDGAGGWTFCATIRPEYNSKGEEAKICMVEQWGGIVYNTTYLWEYDDHGWLTKVTFTCDYKDNYENVYDNFYDANGVIEKRNVYKDGQFVETQYYVWGDPNAVQGVKADNGTAPWYDLSGRRLSTPPTKGIYIHKGRKIVMK